MIQEIYADMFGPEEEIEDQKERWKVTDDNSAEWLIDKVNDELVELNRYEMALDNKIEMLMTKLERVRKEKEDKIARRDAYLMEYFEGIDPKLKKRTKTMEKYRLPSGEIIKKFPGPKYEKNDQELVRWAKESQLDEFIEIKESVKWSELKKNTEVLGGMLVYKATGEVVEGIEIVKRPPTLEFKEV